MEIYVLNKLLLGAVPLFMAFSILFTTYCIINRHFYGDCSINLVKKISIKKEDVTNGK